MLVHLSTTDPRLASDLDGIARRLHDVGTDVSRDDGRHPAPVEGADAVVCLVGGDSELVEDGTHFGERPMLAALTRDVLTIGYDIATSPDTELSHLDGYIRARVEWLRRRLRNTQALVPVTERASLPDMVLRDIRERHEGPELVPHDALRSLHRRLRAHPAPAFDAFTVSMHNADQLYWVSEVPANREVPGLYRGTEPGGAGANTMVALRRLGLKTAVAGAVGDDADGLMLRRALEEDDVATTLLLTVSGVRTGRAVMLRADDGGYSNVVDSGANAEFDAEIDRRRLRALLIDTARRSRVLHLTSFAGAAGRGLQSSLREEVREQTIVSYKPGTLHAGRGVDGLESVLARCDALFIAEAEIDMLLADLPGFGERTTVSNKLDLLFEWRERRGHDRPLIIAVIAGLEDPSRTDPVRLHWGTTRQEGSVRPDVAVAGRPAVKDLAGARDAIVAGVLFGLLRSRPPIDCVNLAHVLAMSAFEEYGCRAALPRPTQVREQWRRLMGSEPPRWLDPYG